MKLRMWLAAAAFVAGQAPAGASCEMDHMRSCYATESTKPDNSRGGATASEFCAAEAVMVCQGRSDLSAMVESAGVSGGNTREISDDLVEEAAAGFVKLQQVGGVAGVKEGLNECWSNAYIKKSFDAAVYCSAFNLAAAKFDETSVAAMGYPPSLSTGEAIARARKAFILSGVPKQAVGTYILTVQQKSNMALLRAMKSR